VATIAEPQRAQRTQSRGLLWSLRSRRPIGPREHDDGLFSRKPKGTWRTIRANYRDLPITEWTDDEEAHFWKTCSPEEYWATWDEWSLDTFEHPTLKFVRRGVLELAREAARDSFPQEFGALLRVKGDTITELVLLPGTIQGDAHAIFQFQMMPVDRTLNGTLHSHPDPHPYPSDADFACSRRWARST